MSRYLLVLAFGWLELLGAPHWLAAQDAGHRHGQPGTASSRIADLSHLARQQIREVEMNVRQLDTAEAARRAGFRPALGWTPTMGVHWVNQERMRDGFDLANPEQLMFSPVEGTMRLVGVAYAFRSAPDARLPAAFDGALDRWHDHPRFAPAGETLHMLHVWFVESPDGPFAGFNPWLPFFAAGVTPPDAERMVDPVADARIRSLAAALGTIAEPTLLGRAAERFADAETVRAIEASRDSIRSFVPRLEDARNEGDWVAWDRLADEAARHWHAIREAWIAAMPFAAGRERLASLLDATMEGRGEHH